MKTIFDHLRECAGNGDIPTLDAEDAQRIVETYDELLEALKVCMGVLERLGNSEPEVLFARAAIKRATESRPLQIRRG